MYKIEPPEGYKIQRQDIIILLVFLCYPFLSALSFYERESIIIPFFPFWNEPIVKILAIVILILGAIITFLSRLHLGKFGTSIILVYDDHKLINKGIYKHIRHPIYLGALIQYTSMGIIIGSIFITSLTFILWILIVNTRINLEEALLFEKFGENYREYQNQTKKLIPFLY
jgi:protein-S-isoprenylcysteine O-methyltransferase